MMTCDERVFGVRFALLAVALGGLGLGSVSAESAHEAAGETDHTKPLPVDAHRQAREDRGLVRPDEPTTQPADDASVPLWEWSALTGDWLGLRPAMARKGITIEPWWILDTSQNWHGGRNTEGGAFRHLFGLDMTFETEPLLDIPGGTFFVQYYLHDGPDASVDDTGDFQVFNNIDADGRSQVAELWYEQRLLDDRLRFVIGKIDANCEFAYLDHGVEFMHSSPGFTPSIFVFPSYPDPALSANVFIYPFEWMYLGFGVYDGALANGIRTGSYGPSNFSHEDLFYIAEGGVTWSAGADRLDGRFGVGGWYHNGTFERFDGGQQNGVGGFYLLLDQLVYREKPDQPDNGEGIGLFACYGHTNREVSEIDHHLSGGLAWTGGLPGRDDDVLGVGANYVHFSQVGGSEFSDHHELAYELFYKFQLTPALAIKPDLQYITNPGGTGLPDAFVATLRIEMAF